MGIHIYFWNPDYIFWIMGINYVLWKKIYFWNQSKYCDLNDIITKRMVQE